MRSSSGARDAGRNSTARVRPRENPYAFACRWLARRERCAAEVAAYLQRHGVDEEPRKAVLARLASERLVDDLRYARLYAEVRSRVSPRSRAFLAEELRRRGVEPAAAGRALEEFFREVSEEDLARRLLAKLPRSGEDWKERAARRLRARGFRPSIVLGERWGSEDVE